MKKILLIFSILLLAACGSDSNNPDQEGKSVFDEIPVYTKPITENEIVELGTILGSIDEAVDTAEDFDFHAPNFPNCKKSEKFSGQIPGTFKTDTSISGPNCEFSYEGSHSMSSNYNDGDPKMDFSIRSTGTFKVESTSLFSNLKFHTVKAESSLDVRGQKVNAPPVESKTMSLPNGIRSLSTRSATDYNGKILDVKTGVISNEATNEFIIQMAVSYLNSEMSILFRATKEGDYIKFISALVNGRTLSKEEFDRIVGGTNNLGETKPGIQFLSGPSSFDF